MPHTITVKSSSGYPASRQTLGCSWGELSKRLLGNKPVLRHPTLPNGGLEPIITWEQTKWSRHCAIPQRIYNIDTHTQIHKESWVGLRFQVWFSLLSMRSWAWVINDGCVRLVYWWHSSLGGGGVSGSILSIVEGVVLGQLAVSVWVYIRLGGVCVRV